MPEVQARLDELLAPDRHIYECALKQHAQHVAEHDQSDGGEGGGIHAAALKHFQSDAFQVNKNTTVISSLIYFSGFFLSISCYVSPILAFSLQLQKYPPQLNKGLSTQV